MNGKFVFFLFLMIPVAFAPVFSSGTTEKVEPVSGQKTIEAFVSVLPQTFFVKEIGGDRVNVDVMVPPGRSPATYEPTPNQVAALSGADVFFTIGVPFEKAFIPTIRDSLKSLEIVDSGTGITRRHIEDHEHEGEEAHDEGSAEADDPHIWLSPGLVKIQARNIHKALVSMDPEGKAVYDEGLNKLISELDDLDQQIKTMLGPYKGKTFFIFHPTLGYFADEYGLKQVAIEAGGKDPSPAELEEIVKHAIEEGVRIIFVQPEFSEESARVIADAINGNVVKINPLDPDYINSLTGIAGKIRQSYE